MKTPTRAPRPFSLPPRVGTRETNTEPRGPNSRPLPGEPGTCGAAWEGWREAAAAGITPTSGIFSVSYGKSSGTGGR